ncbi:single-strand selective monofunctional uracil DNA glycosylase-like isoform X2 [Octopus sinensis]|uniref:Single-strand selective monofunctional uracil DNA glycosylase-like isoform X2 n=1 Tax=Octopus sinensis TaxID=2607531 RepID=A0A7E6EL66_9MOLL|nr:single-strand selective monofunctional uracil DNA glycosylase-like isoform X2 [Octopus sinensis]
MQDTNIPTLEQTNQDENEPKYLDSHGETCLAATSAPIPTAVSASIPDRLLQVEAELCRNLKTIEFTDPVDYVYSPLDYASDTHAKYVHRFCNSQKNVLFLGMNPGPFGMAQNGVPFGECDTVRNWLKIDGIVGKPQREHPKRPVLGLECPRNEVSGKRFWGLFKFLCGTPEVFFKDCYVYNFCPLQFMKTSARNVSPGKLKITERKQLIAACNHAFLQVVQLLQVKLVIGVGNFASENASKAVKGLQQDLFSQLRIETLMHPSPANPSANKNWPSYAVNRLKEIGIMSYTDWKISDGQQQQHQQQQQKQQQHETPKAATPPRRTTPPPTTTTKPTSTPAPRKTTTKKQGETPTPSSSPMDTATPLLPAEPTEIFRPADEADPTAIPFPDQDSSDCVSTDTEKGE